LRCFVLFVVSINANVLFTKKRKLEDHRHGVLLTTWWWPALALTCMSMQACWALRDDHSRWHWHASLMVTVSQTQRVYVVIHGDQWDKK
jgi:hypothetical protein